MKNRISIIQGDITKIAVEVIVNAANTSLLGGGGVDGAIHRAGGKAILEECQKIRARQGGCKVGEAVMTTAGHLPAKYVIHTVGPRWNGGNHDEAQLLVQAYASCFALIQANALTSVSFPNIITGIYRFPKALAATLALESISRFLAQPECPLGKVNIVCFEPENAAIYRALLNTV